MDGLSSTFNLTTRAVVAYFSATASTVGASIRQGAHHAAQKSTNTGLSDCRTSFSKLLSLTSATFSLINDISSFQRTIVKSDHFRQWRLHVPAEVRVTLSHKVQDIFWRRPPMNCPCTSHSAVLSAMLAADHKS